jgi:hypothetical protein
MAVDMLGHLRALHVTPANVQERTQVAVTLAALHVVAFAILMLKCLVELLV